MRRFAAVLLALLVAAPIFSVAAHAQSPQGIRVQAPDGSWKNAQGDANGNQSVYTTSGVWAKRELTPIYQARALPAQGVWDSTASIPCPDYNLLGLRFRIGGGSAADSVVIAFTCEGLTSAAVDTLSIGVLPAFDPFRPANSVWGGNQVMYGTGAVDAAGIAMQGRELLVTFRPTVATGAGATANSLTHQMTRTFTPMWVNPGYPNCRFLWRQVTNASNVTATVDFIARYN